MKPASQISTGYDRIAEMAVDGITNPDMSKWSCTHSGENEIDAWWKVDLLDVYEILAVGLYNRESTPRK